MAEQKKILVVEDEDNHYELILRGCAERSGEYVFDRARSILEARQKISKRPPDLILTDWKLPDGEGIELIDQGPDMNSRTPVVVMTSHGNEAWAVNAMKLGALDYIVKSPAALSDMSQCIARALREWESVIARSQAEEALRISEQKYRVVADNTYNWEFWIGPDDRCQYVSPSCEKITGYPAHRFEEDSFLLNRIIHPEDKDGFEEHRHSARDLKERAEIEFRIVRPDGEVRWIGHACQPMFDEQDRFIGTRGSNRDITRRKTIEMERERLIAELQEALAKIKVLSGLLPICASCKKVKDDQGYWNQIEAYISERSEAEFSHGLCPDCIKKLYPGYPAP